MTIGMSGKSTPTSSIGVGSPYFTPIPPPPPLPPPIPLCPVRNSTGSRASAHPPHGGVAQGRLVRLDAPTRVLEMNVEVDGRQLVDVEPFRVLVLQAGAPALRPAPARPPRSGAPPTGP